MKTAIPNILEALGESEYTELAAAYCKLQRLREHLAGMHDAFLLDGIEPTFDQVAMSRILMEEVFADVEEYVLALIDPGEDICLNYRKAA